MTQTLATPATHELDPDAVLQERDLLRALLLALSNLDHTPAVRPGQSAANGHAPSQTAEITLLRDQLSYLQSSFDPGSPAPPATLPVTALAAVEAAFARLLAELVQETDRRILAERDARTAHATLHRLGIVAVAPSDRAAVAPRPKP